MVASESTGSAMDGIAWPDAAARIASRNSDADWNRSSGRFAIALRTTRRTRPGR